MDEHNKHRDIKVELVRGGIKKNKKTIGPAFHPFHAVLSVVLLHNTRRPPGPLYDLQLPRDVALVLSPAV